MKIWKLNVVLREKTIDFLRDYSFIILFRYLMLNTKENLEGVSKILAIKQMLQILPIALAQVKVGNISENLLNEITHIYIFFVSSKFNNKKVQNNIINLIKL